MPMSWIDKVPIETVELIADDLYRHFFRSLDAQWIRDGLPPSRAFVQLPEGYKKAWIELAEHVGTMIGEAVSQTVIKERADGSR